MFFWLFLTSCANLSCWTARYLTLQSLFCHYNLERPLRIPNLNRQLFEWLFAYQRGDATLTSNIPALRLNVYLVVYRDSPGVHARQGGRIPRDVLAIGTNLPWVEWVPGQSLDLVIGAQIPFLAPSGSDSVLTRWDLFPWNRTASFSDDPDDNSHTVIFDVVAAYAVKNELAAPERMRWQRVNRDALPTLPGAHCDGPMTQWVMVQIR